ncbi:MAG: 4-hydroxy-3-methylbut-2-enyl diphosphate reductase [Alicyclobacillus macrosporangiidus]|uniref:4-hydroxy-3-methylbut-2-enyl diphosphate reductase n=1 Tax=Alicyclobacillus macrosporangiidus TaxID=392015 RepID=UPI0026EEC781|nr:4-hydroxy-3-methylbut-2-enyl diphosphate reductase [Alicyclobacillus macrosporangiidus]MCL6600545.1 4-hydroxy-3-methylbut-2-enyl diphosphate reductase [Alicyclobacillus macrosporangiidus]
MDHVVYLNTLAEGARIGNPEEITREQLPAIARTWKRSGAIAHYKLFGTQTVQWKGLRKTFLIGDIGSAKTMLPVDPEFSGLGERENPERLLNHWISAVVEDYDFEDEANPVLILNRKKALERLQEINARRAVKGQHAFGVIQGITRGGYRLNVAGYPALMPRLWYDWDTSKTGEIGEGFDVEVIDKREAVLVVSRRALLPNPFAELKDRISRGSRVRVKITNVHNNMFKGEIRPGVRVRIFTPTMYRLLHIGQEVMVEIRGHDEREFFGTVV